ncbi:Hypothetical protein FKW44_012863 [Caligus rogercresseyi]|uniref:Uncharacterized protein n=1 Tax=Caligus rogercresseyi TaxID=217165 RepID=A0A7T8HJZ2_CALRO|nr:Hypothetical protein FKW44_012863 [Caligus rogercresseyi]
MYMGVPSQRESSPTQSCGSIETCFYGKNRGHAYEAYGATIIIRAQSVLGLTKAKGTIADGSIGGCGAT